MTLDEVFMNKIDLSKYPTEDLKSLKNQIKEELNKRSRHSQKKYSHHSVSRRILSIHGLNPKDYTDEERKITEIRLFNGHFLLRPPPKNGDPFEWAPYLSSLIAQDWKELYPRESETGDYYVYAHVDPRLKIFITTEDSGGNYGGRPFYIGKGVGNRAYDLKRNEGHGKIIKEILENKFPPLSIVNIIFSGLSEQKALEIEAKLIYFFGVRYSEKRKGWLINLSEPPIPKFVGVMKIIPILSLTRP
jgi:hypothetical protein